MLAQAHRGDGVQTYALKDAAPLLKLSPDSLRKFINRGLIKAVKVGRAWHITQAAIDRYEKERRAPGRPTAANPRRSWDPF